MNKIFLCIVGALVCNTTAGDVTKVLQDGLNGYNGCSDSYISRTLNDSSTFTINYGGSDSLKTAN